MKRCAWDYEDMPPALKGKEFTPNQALCSLRAELDPSKRSLGNNGINMKVSLCTNEEGPPVIVKSLMK